MATRTPRGDSDETAAVITPRTSARTPRKVTPRKLVSAPAPVAEDDEPIESEDEDEAGSAEPAESAEQPVVGARAARAVRASRANARAAAATSAPSRASRTVVIRPDADLDDAERDDLDPADDGYDDEPAESAPPSVSSNGARPPAPARPTRTAAPRPIARPSQDPDRLAPPDGDAAEAATGVTPAVGSSTGRPAAARPAAPPPPVPRPAPATSPAPAASSSSDSGKSSGKRSLPALLPLGRGVLDKIGLLAQLVGLVLFLILAIHVLFVASDANVNNGIVQWFDHRANGVVGDFRDIFSARTGKGRVFLNYGLAAVVYLLAGSLVRRILRR